MGPSNPDPLQTGQSRGPVNGATSTITVRTARIIAISQRDASTPRRQPVTDATLAPHPRVYAPRVRPHNPYKGELRLHHLIYSATPAQPSSRPTLTDRPTRNARPKTHCMEIRTGSLRSRVSGCNPFNIRRFNMQTRLSRTLTANPILTLEDLGLERGVGLDQAGQGLAERSEAQIVRWVQFPAGALFFTLVPDDPETESGKYGERRTTKRSCERCALQMSSRSRS